MRHTLKEIEFYLELVNELINNDYKLKLNKYNGYYHIEVYKDNSLNFKLFSGTKNEIYYTLLNSYNILKIKEWFKMNFEIVKEIKLSDKKYIIVLRNKKDYDSVYFMFCDTDYMMLTSSIGITFEQLNEFSDEDIIDIVIKDDTIKDYYKMIELHEDYVEELLEDVQ